MSTTSAPNNRSVAVEASNTDSHCPSRGQEEEEAFEKACRIWFEAPEGKAEKELREMPKDERERVWADLTGNREISKFDGAPSEDPETLHKAVTDLHCELIAYSAREPEMALSVVLQTTPRYVLNPECMIKFLRAKHFDQRSTVALMARHFEMKRTLFGEESIGRDILLSDLNPQDMEFLTQGAYQYMKGTDRAGRCISFLNFSDPSYSGRLHVLRSLFYINTAMAEKESVQKLGIVRVGYFHQSYPRGGPDNDLIRHSLQIVDAVPIRCVGMYLVSGSYLWTQTIELMLVLASPFVRVRMRIINGSYYENLYNLMCLGIPEDSIPAREDGSLRTEYQVAWLAARKALEEKRQKQKQQQQQQPATEWDGNGRPAVN